MNTTLDLDTAVDLTRTGDLWLFRGQSTADQAIRMVTNAPVNHVGMAITIDDLPPLMWHAELGKGLVDVWTGSHHRGVQLHDLRGAVAQWCGRYEQQAWLRQLSGTITPEMEGALLKTIARLDGTPFPATAALAGRWLRGRVRRPAGVEMTRGPADRERRSASVASAGWSACAGSKAYRGCLLKSPQRRRAPAGRREPAGPVRATSYCAEVVAATYQAMGLLDERRPTNYYDPGKFWSGDDLDLQQGFELGREIAVSV